MVVVVPSLDVGFAEFDGRLVGATLQACVHKYSLARNLFFVYYMQLDALVNDFRCYADGYLLHGL